MCGGSTLSCCPCNPHGLEWALKEKVLKPYDVFEKKAIAI